MGLILLTNQNHGHLCVMLELQCFDALIYDVTLLTFCPVQPEFTAMRDQYMRTGEGFIICYSVIDRRSFEEAIAYRELVTRYHNCTLITVRYYKSNFWGSSFSYVQCTVILQFFKTFIEGFYRTSYVIGNLLQGNTTGMHS